MKVCQCRHKWLLVPKRLGGEKELEENAVPLIRAILRHTCFFAAMVKPSRRRPSRSGLMPHALLWKCIEFQLAQGQSINVPLFTLLQVASGKQTAK